MVLGLHCVFTLVLCHALLLALSVSRAALKPGRLSQIFIQCRRRKGQGGQFTPPLNLSLSENILLGKMFFQDTKVAAGNRHFGRI